MRDLLFKCENCSNYVVVAADASSASVACPECGRQQATPIASVAFVCRGCDWRAAAPQSLTDSIVSCPKCDQSIEAMSLAVSTTGLDGLFSAPGIEFGCPQCSSPLRAPYDLEGKMVACPDCGQVVRVPSAGAATDVQDAAAQPADNPVGDESPCGTRHAFSFPCCECGAEVLAKSHDPHHPLKCPHCGRDPMVPPAPDMVLPVLEQCLFGVHLGEAFDAVCERADSRGIAPATRPTDTPISSEGADDQSPAVDIGRVSRLYLQRPLDDGTADCALVVDFSFYDRKVERLSVKFRGPIDFDALTEMLSETYFEPDERFDGQTLDEDAGGAASGDNVLNWFTRSVRWRSSISGQAVEIRLHGEFPTYDSERQRYRTSRRLPDGVPGHFWLVYEYVDLASQSSRALRQRAEAREAARRDARTRSLRSQLPHT